jgi:putative membrane protein
MDLIAEVCGRFGPGPWWPVFPILFWGLLVAGLIFWARRRPGGWHRGPSAEAVIAERYARGEVSEEEYRTRLAVLRERSR